MLLRTLGCQAKRAANAVAQSGCPAALGKHAVRTTMRHLQTCASTGAAHLRLPGELNALPAVLASLETPSDVAELNAKCEAAAAQTPPLDAINDPVNAREAATASFRRARSFGGPVAPAQGVAELVNLLL